MTFSDALFPSVNLGNVWRAIAFTHSISEMALDENPILDATDQGGIGKKKQWKDELRIEVLPPRC